MKKLILPIMVVASLAFSSTASAKAMTNTTESAAVEISQQASLLNERKSAKEAATNFWLTGISVYTAGYLCSWVPGSNEIIQVISNSGKVFYFNVNNL